MSQPRRHVMQTRSMAKSPSKVEGQPRTMKKVKSNQGQSRSKTKKQSKQEVPQKKKPRVSTPELPESQNDSPCESTSDSREPQNNILDSTAEPSSPKTEYSSISTINLKLENWFSVKTSDDTQDCYLIGIDISPDGRIFVADHLNRSIKIFDENGQHMSSLAIIVAQDSPSDVVVVDNDEAIVSLCNCRELYILDITDKEPIVKSKLETGCRVKRLALYKDKIVTACFEEQERGENFMSVKVMEKSGEIKWSKILNDDGQYLFRNILGVVGFEDGERHVVVVSDAQEEKLTKLDFYSGEVVQIREMKDTRLVGVTVVDTDVIFVSDHHNHVVYALTKGFDRLYNVTGDSVHTRLLYVKYFQIKHQLLITYSYGNLQDCVVRYRVSYS